MRRARWKRKNVRRVGLRRRRPPAAGGGWLALPCRSQGRKRPTLGETFGPGKFGIHPASLFAAAGPVVNGSFSSGPMRASASTTAGERVAKRNARKEKLVKCVFAPRRGRHHPPRGGSTDFAEGPSVPEGKPKSALAPIRRPPCARRATAPERAKRPFLLDRARPVFFSGKTEKKMGGASWLDQPPAGADTPVAAVRRPHRIRPVIITTADFRHPSGWLFVLDNIYSIEMDK